MSDCNFTVRSPKKYGTAENSYVRPVAVSLGNDVTPLRSGQKIDPCFLGEHKLQFNSITGTLTIGSQSVNLFGQWMYPPAQTPVVVVSPADGVVGAAYNSQIVVANATAASITNLPAGLSVVWQAVGGAMVGTITGTPTALFDSHLYVVAANSAPNTVPVGNMNLNSDAVEILAFACPAPTLV